MQKLTKISNNVNIKEGRTAIDKYVFTLLCSPNSSIKYLSNTVSLPVPICTAIKNELKKEKMIEMKNGVSLTTVGEKIVRQELQIEAFNVQRYKQVIAATSIDWILQELPMLLAIFEKRPEADVTIDQSKCTLETAIKRAIVLMKERCLLNTSLLCLGDDDLVSVTCGLLHRYVFLQQESAFSITVIDKDERIVEYIRYLAKTYQLPITPILHNLSNELPTKLQHRFECMITDPPYTKEGLELFVSRGISSLKKEASMPIFLSYSKKSIEELYDIQKFLIVSGIVITTIKEKFNTYEGAQIIGGVSDLYCLQTTIATKSLIVGKYQNKIYTREQNPRLRKYRCLTCKRKYVIGDKQRYQTIEKLKHATCAVCQGTKFKQLG